MEGKETAVGVTVKRNKCPFYGMFLVQQMFVDQKGNACALLLGYSPCPMETSGETPCWDSCNHFNRENNKKDIARLFDTSTAFPDELNTENHNPWEGVTAREWFRYVMGRDLK